jgi:hypothetical protein
MPSRIHPHIRTYVFIARFLCDHIIRLFTTPTALSGEEYSKEDVRCCDFCVAHLSTGDQNSLLRYFNILRGTDCPAQAKFIAAQTLLMSIEVEKIPPDDAHIPLASCFPALIQARFQLGLEMEALWGCLVENLTPKYPSQLREIVCRIIVR